MTDRLPPLDPAGFTPRQRDIHADIVARRGGAGGPFPAWLRNPELAHRAQALGAYCRYDSSLSQLLSELAILVVARHWRAQAEWAIHAPIAARAGLPDDAIRAIRAGADPQLDDPAAVLVHDYTDQLLRTNRITDALHARAVRLLGQDGVVDLVALIGYYGLVAVTLNAFDMPVPEGRDIPFDEDTGSAGTGV
ncbi:carboxymuconolactone decarboxylase family protein [Pseudooceanicola aestuarii]|uniref:carboxymuconolactone decarboxylase family protein n=1 Tax=Pseudooceanicola aestuarii TaxID=2697319 RepID=UPI0013D3A478|nr:carboxymuconolactone decarboxylase family protein [Pseudooceanicola aestuarii]